MKINEIEKIVKDFEAQGADTITKIYFVYIAKDFDGWQELDEQEKSNLINYIYTFWIKSDLNENYIYNLFEIVDRLGRVQGKRKQKLL